MLELEALQQMTKRAHEELKAKGGGEIVRKRCEGT